MVVFEHKEVKISTEQSLIVIFLVLGAFVRIYNFWIPEFWRDEYGTWWAIAPVSWSEVCSRVLFKHGQSPFYYFISRFFADHLGTTTFALRLPSVLFAIAGLPVFYQLALRVLGDRYRALLALAAFSVDEALIWYSQDARPYSLALFFALLSFLCFISLLERPNHARQAAYILSTAAAYYAHYLFGFIVIIQVAYLLFSRVAVRERIGEWCFSYLLLCAVCVPGFLQIAALFHQRRSINWIGSDWTAPFQTLFDLINPKRFSIASILALALNLRIRRFASLKKYGGLALIWFLMPVVFFGIAPILFDVALVHRRYLLYVIPAASLIYAIVMAVNLSDWRRWIPLIAFLALAFFFNILSSLKASRTFSQRDNEKWPEAVQFLETSYRQGDVVLYNTEFAEEDLFATSKVDPQTQSFIEWPIRANLHGSIPMTGLPYRIDSQTNAYLSKIFTDAARHPRIWMIGRDLKGYVEKSKFKLLEKHDFGVIGVDLLTSPERRQ